MNSEPLDLHIRILVLAPTAKDGAVTTKIFNEIGLGSKVCENLTELCEEARQGAGVAILPEESLLSDHAGLLSRLFEDQPAWSDFPVIVLAKRGLSVREDLREISFFRRFTLLERPMQIAVLISAVRAAIRDRHRQYQMRDHIVLLQKTEESLRLADRRKDEFLAMLSHELRNPLAAISSGVKLLNRPSAPEEIKKFAYTTLDHQVKVMAHLISDLLDISRITNGKIALKKLPLDLPELLEDILKLMNSQIEAAGHKVQMDLNEEIWIFGDTARIEQIFTNLISNAIKYSNRGGTISVSATQSKNVAKVVVQDSGIGISSELLPKIFDLFTQAENSLARSQGGLGIGLTLVKKLMDMHDGEVIATSEGKDKGCTFTLLIPTIKRPHLVESEKVAEKQITKGQRILVVDDNRDAALTLGHFLSDCGCRVEIAFSSKEALRKAQDFCPEAALLDIGLPEVNGYELARKLLQISSLQNTMLIALTGYDKTEDRILSKKSGFKYHLAKPVDHDLLLSLLAS